MPERSVADLRGSDGGHDRDSDADAVPGSGNRPLKVLVAAADSAMTSRLGDILRRMDQRIRMELAPTAEDLARVPDLDSYDVVIVPDRRDAPSILNLALEIHRHGADTPLIVVTAVPDDARHVECLAGGAAAYVSLRNADILPIVIRRVVAEKFARDQAKIVRQLIETARDEVRDREDRFRQLAENIDEVFFIMDAGFRETLYINPAYERLWGRSRQSLYDDPHSYLDAVVSEDRPALQEYLRQVLTGKQPGKLEFRVKQPGGEIRWVQVHAVPIRNDRGEIYRLSGVALDITHHHEARAALEESAERFRKFTEASFDGIAITRQGVVVEVNRGFLDIFGCQSDFEVVGRSILAFIAPESVDEVGRRERENIEGTYEAVGVRLDKKKIFLEATSRRHLVGAVTTHLTAFRDVTERRILEGQFRQAQKMEAVGRLAGGVAHDFNNLLTVITINTDMLLNEFAIGDPRRSDLQEIRKAAEGAAGLTRQLLAFSRQQVIEPQVIVLDDVLRQTDKLLHRLVGEDIDLNTRFGCGECVLHIDPGQLEQVVMNLVVNARDAMPTGGKITIETDIVQLDEAYADAHWPIAPGDYALLSVSDTGIGMDEATRAKIFEPFFTTKEPGKGTGLGLATVYGIVKQNGGFVWVYSEPGKGSTFKVYLPLHPESATPVLQREEMLEAGALRGRETILLVEDSQSVRELTVRALKEYGYDVFQAALPNDAFRIAANLERELHLVLTDVVMPEMSGRVMAERIATLQPRAKVLFMSGYTDDAVIRHGILRAQMPFIQKPFTSAGLARRVREVLDGDQPSRSEAS